MGFVQNISSIFGILGGYDFYHSILDAWGNAQAETSQEEWVSRVDELWMFGCWSTDEKWGASRGESSPSFLESVNGAVGHVLQVQPVPGCVFFLGGGGP